MDVDKDDKSIVGKTVEAVKNFADNISEAVHKTAEPEPVIVPPFIVIRQPTNSKRATAKAAKTTRKKATSPTSRKGSR
jgi:hypothetical protein